MNRTRRTRWLAPVVAGAVIMTTGCSQGGGLGASTSCGRYRNLGREDQNTAVAQMTKAHNDSTPVGIVRFSVSGYCLLNPDKPIGGVYGSE